MNLVSAVGILYKDSILLCRRSEFWRGEPVPFGGYWSIFTGSVEKNENPLHCAIREVKEESDIDINPELLKYITTSYQNDIEINVYMYKSDHLLHPKLNEEHTEYGWFDINELDKFPYLIDDHMLNLIKKMK